MIIIKFSNQRLQRFYSTYTHEQVLEFIDFLNIGGMKSWYHSNDKLERTYWLLRQKWLCRKCNTEYYQRITICEKCGERNIEYIENWIKEGLKVVNNEKEH